MSLERESRRTLKDVLADCRTVTQFAHYSTSMLDDLTKTAYKRFVGDVGPEEILDIINVLAQLKGRYLAQAIADLTARRLPAVEQTEQLRALRLQIEEVTHALDALQKAVEWEMVGVRGINAPASASQQPIMRLRPDQPTPKPDPSVTD